MTFQSRPFRLLPHLLAFTLLLTTSLLAQNPGWRRANEPAPVQSADPTTPVARPDDFDASPGDAQPAETPSRLTIRPGTFITARINQPLSSDRNQVGDFFSATLAAPLVVDGVIVAQRGQTLAGRVAEVERGKRFSGVSRLGVQLTELTAVDGQQLPIQTQFIGRTGPSTAGRNVGTVAGTTAVGAVIGTAADWGRGAAIGAGIGAAAGIAGVLLSHGAPAVLYPESVLTFRLESPVGISTERAPQAFRYVDPNDYRQPEVQYRAAAPAPTPPPPYYYGASYPYPYAYGYPYSYWGPRVGVVIAPRPFYRGGYYRRWR